MFTTYKCLKCGDYTRIYFLNYDIKCTWCGNDDMKLLKDMGDIPLGQIKTTKADENNENND